MSLAKFGSHLSQADDGPRVEEPAPVPKAPEKEAGSSIECTGLQGRQVLMAISRWLFKGSWRCVIEKPVPLQTSQTGKNGRAGQQMGLGEGLSQRVVASSGASDL